MAQKQRPVQFGPQTGNRLLKIASFKELGAGIEENISSELPRSIMIQTPSGGIGAGSVSGADVTFGQATCKLVIVYDDAGTKKGKITTQDVEVYNNFEIEISGSAIVHAKLIGNLYFVDTDNCGA